MTRLSVARAALGPIVLLAVEVPLGCRGSAPSLPGAVNQGIPIYAPSRLVSRRGFSTGEMPGVTSWAGIHWELETSDPPERVKGFYDATLPVGWTRKPEDEGGSEDHGDNWHYSLIPPGAERGEGVDIAVYKEPVHGKTRILISEEVLEAKRGG